MATNTEIGNLSAVKTAAITLACAAFVAGDPMMIELRTYPNAMSLVRFFAEHYPEPF
jgi:hypothetical protein